MATISTVLFTMKGLIHKEKLLQLVLELKQKVEGRVDSLEKTPPYWNKDLGEWLAEVRLDGVQLYPNIG